MALDQASHNSAHESTQSSYLPKPKVKNEFPLQGSIVRDNIVDVLIKDHFLCHTRIIKSQNELIKLLLHKGDIRMHDFWEQEKGLSNSKKKSDILQSQAMSKLTDLQEILENIEYFRTRTIPHKKLSSEAITKLQTIQQLIQHFLSQHHIDIEIFQEIVAEKRKSLGSFHKGVFLYGVHVADDT